MRRSALGILIAGAVVALAPMAASAQEGEGEGEGEGAAGEGEGEGEGAGEGEGEGEGGEEGEGEPPLVLDDNGCPVVPVGEPCERDQDCGGGGVCLVGIWNGYCSVDADEWCCPEGTKPEQVPEGSVETWCVRSCREDADCQDDINHFCVAGGAYCWGCYGGPIGASCERDSDCGQFGLCINDDDATFPAGYCTVDSGVTCCPDTVANMELYPGVYRCVAQCESDADCRAEDDFVCDLEQEICWQYVDPSELDEPGEGEGEGEGAEGEGEGGDGDPIDTPPPGTGNGPPRVIGGDNVIVSRDEADEGCGCAVGGGGAPGALPVVLALALAGLAVRRR